MTQRDDLNRLGKAERAEIFGAGDAALANGAFGFGDLMAELVYGQIWNRPGLSRQELIAAVKDAGVVGLGGAAFPAHVKLAPPPEFPIETLMVNGCECEPYLTTDHRTMVEYPERVQLGVRIMMTCLGAKRAIIGIERNKPDAIAAIQGTLPPDLDVKPGIVTRPGAAVEESF